MTVGIAIHASAQDLAEDFSFKGVSVLPSADVSKTIAELPRIGAEEWTKQATAPRELQVDPELRGAGGGEISLNDAGMGSLPFVVPNSIILQFTPQTTSAEIADYLATNQLPVVRSFPGIGAVQVEADLSKYFTPELTDKSPNDALIRGLTAAVSDFTKDARIQSASPDILLTGKDAGDGTPEITNMLTPSEVTLSVGMDERPEIADWGIADIEADSLWGMPGANDGVIFGVMDVGFSRHEDIVFLDFPTASVSNSHGNHVAAIGCGLHNGKGMEGVLPNCFVRARSGDVFFEGAEGNPQIGFMVSFSQILASLDQFIDEQDDVSAFNVSLGYNWRSNFGINPDLPESLQWRQLVEMQGTMLVGVLELAQRKNKVIFSAAGNDSQGLATPIGAKYASPFNWAAIIARERGIAQNGIIVGAHGPDGKRAGFSNANAQISCPGVDVLSAVAFGPTGQPSNSAYGKMSGTSMASPYCAAANILFRLVRPGYTSLEAANCMMASDVLTDDNTPRLKLTKALAACPPRG
ncbi:MAG: S8 family serine peptidase [Hyphomicrobiales bacterium]|nr:S8 family serine peptidase [Hyphomicrobiales bacterium]